MQDVPGVASMEGGGGGGGDPGGDSKPTVTIVHKIKCKLGYAELHKPAPGFGPGEEVGSLSMSSSIT